MSETATRPAATSQGSADSGRPPIWRTLIRWEGALVAVLVAVLIFGGATSSDFFSGSTLFFTGLNMGDVAIMALPLLFIIMVGEIDLSVAAMLGLAGAVMGNLYQNGHSIWLAMAVALVVGALGGTLNGVLVARIGLPSIAVTIGTLTLFRGLAEVTLTNPTSRIFPTSLSNVSLPIHGTQLSYSAAIFIGLAVIFGIVLHATPLGRSLIAIGLQNEAAKFAGIRVDRIKLSLYVLSGIICAFVGILFTLEHSSASYSAGYGLELNTVAIVLFGGVSIFGGRGTVIGVVLAVAIFGALQQALTLNNVSPEVQNIITGGLLLLSVIVPNSGEAWRRIKTHLRGYG
jgi:rhamnose transport system permease protein